MPAFDNINTVINTLSSIFPYSSEDPLIIVSINEQKLVLIENKQLKKSYTISSALAGIGNLSGSYKTPLGIHTIAEKIGKDASLGSLFKARINTKKNVTILTNPNQKSDTDNITSRILWLKGMEDGINKGGNVDSYNRYIYIHGTDEEGRLGKPASHGCIRMANQSVIDLFSCVSVGTFVVILE